MTLGNHSRPPSMAARILTKLLGRPTGPTLSGPPSWPLTKNHKDEVTAMPPAHFYMRKRRSKYMLNVEEAKHLKQRGLV